jgi:plasmid stabilization system protein ParE
LSARRFRFHPHAGTELVEEAEYLRADDRQVAADFEDEVRRAIDRLLEHPEIGEVILERRGRRIRKWGLHPFRFTIIYALLDDIIRILAVAHHRRRPGYWLYRLRTL